VTSSAIGSGSVVLAGGTETLTSGGVEVGGKDSGTVLVSSGGATSSETVTSGGTETVGSGGTASGTVVNSSGVLSVTTSGTALAATISSGGNESITGNGVTSSAIGSGSVVLAGGTETLTSGGVEVGGKDSGTVNVSSGGATTSEMVGAGGTESVGSGGTVSATTLSGTNAAGLSATLAVTTSGTTVGAIVGSGGLETITGNGTNSSAIGSGSIVLSGGTENLYNGGVEVGGKDSGEFQVYTGLAVSETVSSGGDMGVAAAASGTVVDAGGTERLGAGGTETGGTLSGGTLNAAAFSNPGTVNSETVLSGGVLSLGNGTANSTLVGSGGSAIIGVGGTATNTTISGGTVVISAGGTDSGPITFAGSGGTLVVDGTTLPTGTVSGFSGSDQIVFSGLAYAGASITTTSNTIVIHENGSSYTLNISSVSPVPNYMLVNDGGVVELVPCYAAGTHILTPDGEMLVEHLLVGDKVITVREGGPSELAITWVGQRTLDISRHARPEEVYPVRILAGAFGPGVPERDLRVSPRHAIYVDGVFFEARALLNGATIIQERNTKFVTYHHIELEQHDVMLAEGLPAESFLDTGNRNMFEGEDTLVLHPDFAAASDAGFCVPVVREGAALVAVRQRLLDRVAALGFTPNDAVQMVAKAGAKFAAPMRNGNVLSFNLVEACDTVELHCEAATPFEMSAAVADERVLGVAITRLTLVTQGERIEIALDAAGHEGFHGVEDGHRWTNGAARIALPAHNGPAVLEVETAGQAVRWSAPAAARAVG
jgi:autotransporter passenger strand-loop-strand repeat protein